MQTFSRISNWSPVSFDSRSVIDGMVLDVILFLVPTYDIAYEPKGDILLLKSGGDFPNTMVASPRSL